MNAIFQNVFIAIGVISLITGCSSNRIVTMPNGSSIDTEENIALYPDALSTPLFLSSYQACQPEIDQNINLITNWFKSTAPRDQVDTYQVAKDAAPTKANELIRNFYFEQQERAFDETSPTDTFAYERRLEIKAFDPSNQAAEIITYVKNGRRWSKATTAIPMEKDLFYNHRYVRKNEAKNTEALRKLYSSHIQSHRKASRGSRDLIKTLRFMPQNTKSIFIENKKQYLSMSNDDAYRLLMLSKESPLEAVFIFKPLACAQPETNRSVADRNRIANIPIELLEIQIFADDKQVFQSH
ncbi:hypothetical protein DFP76_1202 [Marinomonas aquiplantarum]|uniref:Uncharacterized protein n=2 Tax=Marinomonas aquiplantarum TaxID=491951 RepID=A0A366CU32_9GAMM|nr:hypothetical protein DFP76_1202 [Marinomonas aquiplantarum]